MKPSLTFRGLHAEGTVGIDPQADTRNLLLPVMECHPRSRQRAQRSVPLPQHPGIRGQGREHHPLVLLDGCAQLLGLLGVEQGAASALIPRQQGAIEKGPHRRDALDGDAAALQPRAQLPGDGLPAGITEPIGMGLQQPMDLYL